MNKEDEGTLVNKKYTELVEEMLRTKEASKLKNYVDTKVQDVGIQGIDTILNELLKGLDQQLDAIRENPVFKKSLSMDMFNLILAAQKKDNQGYEKQIELNIKDEKTLSAMVGVNEQLERVPAVLNTQSDVDTTLNCLATIAEILKQQRVILIWCAQKTGNDSLLPSVTYPLVLKHMRNAKYHNRVKINTIDRTVYWEDGPDLNTVDESETIPFERVLERLDIALSYFSAFILADLLSKIYQLMIMAQRLK